MTGPVQPCEARLYWVRVVPSVAMVDERNGRPAFKLAGRPFRSQPGRRFEFSKEGASILLLAASLHLVVASNADRLVLCTGFIPVGTDRAVKIVTCGTVVHCGRPVGTGVLPGIAHFTRVSPAEHAPRFLVFFQECWSCHVSHLSANTGIRRLDFANTGFLVSGRQIGRLCAV
jgi:hypothetical protein